MLIFENQLNNHMEFPVEAFIQDNSIQEVSVPEHWHECFELLYILEGEALQRVNANTFEVKSGDFLFLYNGDIHATYCSNNVKTRIFVLKFMPSVIHSDFLNTYGSKYLIPFLSPDYSISHLTDVQKSIIQKLFSQIESEIVTENSGYQLFVRGYILQLLGFLTREEIVLPFINSHTYAENKNLESILAYIETNFNKDLNLGDISMISNMNYSYTSRYFKQITGKNFKQYLDYVRIAEVNRLLFETDHAITEIANFCGFSSSQALCRTYKRLMGISPSKMRNQPIQN